MAISKGEGGLANPAFVQDDSSSEGVGSTPESLREHKASLGGIPNPAFNKDSTSQDSRSLKSSIKDARKESRTVPKGITQDEKVEKLSILKNIVIISVAFIFLFTAYNSMANLQSSINKEMGTAALSTLYGALVVSCCFVPSWLIKRLKEKHTLSLCMLGYTSYIAAQFYPQYYTLIPTAILLGIGAAPMWSSKCTYLTKVGTRYAHIVGENPEVIITRFFGIFFLFFQSTQVWGNLITSTVLSVGAEDPVKSEEDLKICGYEFCPWYNVSAGNSTGIPQWQMYTMSSIYLVFALLASLIIFLFVDPLTKFENIDTKTSNEERTGLQLLLATFNHMRHPYQLLIFPLTIWSGVEQAFLSADFTAAYVSCGLGVHMVGYVLICYGICDVIGSISFTPLVKSVGRIPVFLLGFSINLSVVITLMYWMPNPDQVPVFFVLAGLWGFADAIWQTQINAFYGVIFPGESEAAFSNYRLWESLGFIIAYACSTVTCIPDKIVTLLVFLSVGITGYLTIEVIEKTGRLKRDGEGKVVPVDKVITGRY